MPTSKISDRLTPTPMGSWSFREHLGDRIRTILDQRIASDQARLEIHPELVETLHDRVDDVIRPGFGMWQGEFWGKWILSAIEAARYLDDGDLKALIAASVDQVLETQDADGYLGTYQDPDFMIPPGGKGPNWNIWGRKYTLWGLLAAWELLGDPRILEGAAKMVDHLMTQVGPGRVDIIRTGQLYGLPSTSILTPIVMLYEATGETRYLQFAEYIVNQWARHPDGPPDILHKGLGNTPIHTWFPEPYRWAKSYEFISCVEGLLHLYKTTGRGVYLRAVENIYEHLRTWERSIVGSISFNDKFVGSRRLINIAGEICDAVYWNRLSFELFCLTGATKYADEFELSLYNALLTGMNPAGSWGLRRLRLSHEHVPAHHHCDLAHQQCCVANAPRGLLQAAEMAWMTDDEGLACVLYNSGTGTLSTPSGQTLQATIDGRYPADGEVTITFDMEQAEKFACKLRIPLWSVTTAVTVNDAPAQEATAGGWFRLTRTWQPGDKVALRLDMRPRYLHFDAAAIAADDPLVTWATEEWAKLANMEPGAPPNEITTDDALPHRDAVAIARGPLVLARDVRLGTPEIFDDLPVDLNPDVPPSLEPITPPDGIWVAFEAIEAPALRLCDFASAGNTWDAGSRFTTWIPKQVSHA